MGLLDELFSAYDSKTRQLKRKMAGLLSDPAETIYQGIRNFGEDQRGLLDTQAQAYPWTGMTPQAAPDMRARKELADTGASQGVAGMFIGKGAKTWDALAAKKAEELAVAGADPRKIWAETGSWKAPDGAWRQEIPDNVAKMIGDTEKTLYKRINPGDSLSDRMKHKKLFDAYPLGEIGVEQYPGLGASYSPGYTREQLKTFEKVGVDVPSVLHEKMLFGVNTNSEDVLHELQHAIQQREKWAQGGSPAKMAKPENKVAGLHPEEAYKRLAGEAEARATQARIPLDAAQRRALFPEDSYDVPMNQLIIRGLLSQ